METVKWESQYMEVYIRYRFGFFAVLQYDGVVICGRRKGWRIDHESDPQRFETFQAANEFMTKHGHELVEQKLRPYVVVMDGCYNKVKMIELEHIGHQVHYWEQVVGTSIRQLVVPGHDVRIVRRPGGLDSQILLDGAVIWQRVSLTEEDCEIARRIAKRFQSSEEELADRGHQPNPDCAHGHPAHVPDCEPLAAHEWRALEANGWKCHREVVKTGSADGQGRWHTGYHEHIAVEAPSGAVAHF